MWNYDNRDDKNNINKHVQLYIAYHLSDAGKYPEVIYLNPFITPREWDAGKVLFLMRGYGSLGYQYRKKNHYSSRRRNGDDRSSEEEYIGVYLGEEGRGHVYIDTIHCY